MNVIQFVQFSLSVANWSCICICMYMLRVNWMELDYSYVCVLIGIVCIRLIFVVSCCVFSV